MLNWLISTFLISTGYLVVIILVPLFKHQVDVEKIQKNDIKKFGEMVYRIINEHYTRGAILFKNIFKKYSFFSFMLLN